ncbi:uncharacterized protein LOC131940122 [Physella acuta]|uniref:uncharacterized protein LOC131940122 n=1 Tax=Physella acuta TaxID=109671 RepID=UPI0027DBC515|nr:uncharacterized protein LOC131940122 [Physella acuta]
MYHQRVLLIVVLYISTRTNEAFELKLTSSKPIIAPNLEESLELKCELQATDPLELINGGAGNITSITVSRGDDVIASISSCGPAKTFSDHQTISVKGEVSGDSGYLQLHWTTSSTKQAGNYTCNLILETGEQAAMLNKVITIKARQPSVEELLDVITKLNEKVEMSEKEIQNLTKRVDTSENEMKNEINAAKKASKQSVEELSDIISKMNLRVNISEHQIQNLSASETMIDKKLTELDVNLRKQGMRMETGYRYCGNSDDYQWFPDEDNRRRSTFRIHFQTEFDSPPVVSFSLIYVDTTASQNQTRYWVRPDDVTTKGFNLVCDTWASSKIYQIEVFWIAFKN